MVLNEAKRLLAEVTPLRKDCGRVCGGACCRSMAGEETGMLLFPGEEDDYEDAPGWQCKAVPMGTLAICPGHCDRAMRPLACRLFPLLPLLREDGIHVAMDARARAVCPLARQGQAALGEDFRQAVLEAGRLLAQDATQARFLRLLTENQDEWTALRRRLSR